MNEYSRSAEAYDLIQMSRGRPYADHAAAIARKAKERKPNAASLLDVACGTGIHLMSFQKQFEVAGVDSSEAMLARARPRLPGVDLRPGDMRTFDLRRTYDVVTCLFSSVGYMLTLGDLRSAIANMARHVTDRGVLVVEPWLHGNWRVPHQVAESANGPGIAVARVSTNGREGHVSTFDWYWTIAKEGKVESFVEHHRTGLYSVDDYREAIEATGLTAEHDPVGLIGRGLFIGTKR